MTYNNINMARRKAAYTVKTLQAKADTFIKKLYKGEVIPTKQAWYLHMNLSRTAVHYWKETKPELFAIHEEVLDHIEVALQTQLLTSNKPVGAMFLLKASFGYREYKPLDNPKKNNKGVQVVINTSNNGKNKLNTIKKEGDKK